MVDAQVPERSSGADSIMPCIIMLSCHRSNLWPRDNGFLFLSHLGDKLQLGDIASPATAVKDGLRIPQSLIVGATL
jgi:hypothetical protein